MDGILGKSKQEKSISSGGDTMNNRTEREMDGAQLAEEQEDGRQGERMLG